MSVFLFPRGYLCTSPYPLCMELFFTVLKQAPRISLFICKRFLYLLCPFEVMPGKGETLITMIFLTLVSANVGNRAEMDIVMCIKIFFWYLMRTLQRGEERRLNNIQKRTREQIS